jgi:hypothetical protein
MKYITIILICLWCNVGWGFEYKRTPPEKPLIIVHDWYFDRAEIQAILIQKLKDQGVELPSESNIQIKYRIFDNSYMAGIAGISLTITEETTVIEKKDSK